MLYEFVYFSLKKLFPILVLLPWSVNIEIPVKDTSYAKHQHAQPAVKIFLVFYLFVHVLGWDWV